MAEKIFRDPLYGYITIGEEYCKNFIDTPIFQRLRRIEQTSMRILYPSAHHDRFAHSIGVFHLGQTAFRHLKNNSANELRGIVEGNDWEKYRVTFEIACLMHDCGHSPFSHTFENNYMSGTRGDIVKRRLFSFFKGCNIEREYNNRPPASHEVISALLLLEQFSDKINSLNGDPLLAARMIMGCGHLPDKDRSVGKKDQFENRLVSLLNGSAFDVDSLDYIQRDSWASGVSNVEIDLIRLLSALMIKRDDHDKLRIFFKKSALSTLENVSLGRNFLYKWVYSHHKVVYEQYLLKAIVEKIDEIAEKKGSPKFSDTLFSIEALVDGVMFGGGKYVLPTDDDVIHAMKSYRGDVPEVEEYLSRNYKYKALWKTFFEFNEVYFEGISELNRNGIVGSINAGALQEYCGDKVHVEVVEPKMKGIRGGELFIDVDGKQIDAERATSLKGESLRYFIVYVTPELRERKEEVIEKIRSLSN